VFPSSVEKALEQAVREGDALLTLRLRGQVDEETFERRRGEINERQAQLRLKLEGRGSKPEEVLACLDCALAFPQIAQDVMRQHDVVGRRQIVQAIGSNWKVQDRKALYIAKRPFSYFTESTASSLGWAIAEDVRTWLLSGEYLWIPDLTNPLSAETSADYDWAA